MTPASPLLTPCGALTGLGPAPALPGLPDVPAHGEAVLGEVDGAELLTCGRLTVDLRAGGHRRCPCAVSTYAEAWLHGDLSVTLRVRAVGSTHTGRPAGLRADDPRVRTPLPGVLELVLTRREVLDLPDSGAHGRGELLEHLTLHLRYPTGLR